MKKISKLYTAIARRAAPPPKLKFCQYQLARTAPPHPHCCAHPQFNAAKQRKIQSPLHQPPIDQHGINGEGDCRSVIPVLATIVDSKNNIHFRDFKDVDLTFNHFANFEFAYFEIQESFGLIWVKLQNG